LAPLSPVHMLSSAFLTQLYFFSSKMTCLHCYFELQGSGSEGCPETGNEYCFIEASYLRGP
jgi:hypothetical protein